MGGKEGRGKTVFWNNIIERFFFSFDWRERERERCASNGTLPETAPITKKEVIK